METILVTGAAGFIGSNIAEALLAGGRRVVAIDDLSAGRLDAIDHLLHNRNFTFVRGSLLDRGLLRSLIRIHQVTAVSHQAAITGVGRSLIDPVGAVEANITGSANVFDSAAEARCRRVVFASSWAVYGDCPEPLRTEDMQPLPGSPYAVTKAAQEMLARTFCCLHSLEIVGLRYFTVYGRRQEPSPAVVPRFIGRAIRNQPLSVQGDGLQSRDFVHVDDVVRANLLALAASRDASGKCFNVGSGTATTMLDLARMIIRLARSTSRIEMDPPRAGDLRACCADLSRSRRELGYAPSIGLEEGIGHTVAWYQRRMPAAKAAC